MTKKHLHERRGVTFQEIGALLGVREMLARGMLLDTDHQKDEPGEHVFNMNVPCQLDHACGTVACIGGTMALLMGYHNPAAYVSKAGTDGKFQELFYPQTARVEWSEITPAHAVQAIDNWLKDGNPRWKAATS